VATRPFNASPIVASALAAAWPLAFLPGMLEAFLNARRVPRVEDWVDRPQRADRGAWFWNERYEDINGFERHLDRNVQRRRRCRARALE